MSPVRPAVYQLAIFQRRQDHFCDKRPLGYLPIVHGVDVNAGVISQCTGDHTEGRSKTGGCYMDQKVQLPRAPVYTA